MFASSVGTKWIKDITLKLRQHSKDELPRRKFGKGFQVNAYFLSTTIAKCRVISILGGSDWAEVSRVSHCGHYPRQMRHIDDSDSANYQQLFSFLIKHSISFLYFFTQYPNSRIFIYFDQHLKEALLRPQMLESFIK